MKAAEATKRSTVMLEICNDDSDADNIPKKIVRDMKLKTVGVLRIGIAGGDTHILGKDEIFDLRADRKYRYGLQFSGIVPLSFANSINTAHGGVIAFLVDHLTSIALLSLDKKHNGVSIKIATEYLSALPIGGEILINATIFKSSNRFAFAELIIINKKSNRIAVKGSHIKFNSFPSM
eukprot:TRINITY_DN14622_c0_g1_i1.p1 TRINITY_DN14622_c0_g1~~TRINITY_DN14622_c0_g1_i1.p1  ORF type:complete len:188 (-),score=29.37 TRINITY_DN14622_c0_g1_i1:23-556(-)